MSMPEEMIQQQQPNHDETIRALSRNEGKVEALTDVVRELKRAVEEMSDRMDADLDTFRAKSEAFAVTASAVTELQRRTTVLETKVEALAIDNTKLECRLETALIERTRMETKLEAVSVRVYLISGAAAAITWIAGKVFR